MLTFLIIAGVVIVPILIYVIFRLAGLAWFTSMLEITKNKQEDVVNERIATKRKLS